MRAPSCQSPNQGRRNLGPTGPMGPPILGPERKKNYPDQGFGEMNFWDQLSKKHSDGPSRMQNEYFAVQSQMGCEVLSLESIYLISQN